MIARPWLEQTARRLEKSVFPPVGVALETLKAVRARVQIASFQQRVRVVQRFPERFAEQRRPKVLAVVTHLSDPGRPAGVSVERLERTLDGLIESLGHTQLALVLNTLPERHVVASLPEHQRSRLEVRERIVADPMFLGFEAQGEFVDRLEDFDWFLYLEDDLILGDGLLLEKLAFFNRGAPPEALLLPHRYEFWNGRKTYIDLSSKAKLDFEWNRLTVIETMGWKFAEFDNPHSGWYCLSREQLGRWLDTGRHWYGLCSYYGPRESAATGCLAEAFRLYKPHPENMSYLEIRHLDTKYAELYARIHHLEQAEGD